MPKISKELSALSVSRLKESGFHAVGGVSGLYLKIDGNSKSWVLRAVIAGKRRKMGLGGYPSVTLAQAKEKAREARVKIEQGIDPIDERLKAVRQLEVERSKQVTFAQAAQLFIAAKEIEWKNAKHRWQWSSTLETFAFPVIGNLPVADIQQAHILKILEPIWRTKTETATRLRGRIEKVLDWSIARGLREQSNPALWRGYLDKILPQPKKIQKQAHMAAVPYKEAAKAYSLISHVNGVSAKALMFQILTAVRPGEVRGATWDEIDFQEGAWNIPAERMKMKVQHRVPLSKQAINLLLSLPRVEGTDLIFPSPRLKVLSDMAMTKVMRGLGLESSDGRRAVAHGFRSTFRDWAAECTDHTNEVAEMALAHAIKNEVEAAYRRGDLFRKRAQLMQDWADYCVPID